MSRSDDGYVNLGSFSGCEEGCNCGAQLTLGLTAALVPRVVAALHQAGLTLMTIPPPSLSQDAVDELYKDDPRTELVAVWKRAYQGQVQAAKDSKEAMTALNRYLKRRGALPVRTPIRMSD
jgi:hypothetical protein